MNERVFKKCLLLVICFASVLGSAQNSRTVTGTIKDTNGIVLPGVNVILEDTTKGTATDFDGNYSVNAAPTDILVFSFLGYQTKKQVVGNKPLSI